MRDGAGMVKSWTQTICLAVSCGMMLVIAMVTGMSWLSARFDANAADNRALVNTLAEQFQAAHLDMMERVTKVEEKEQFDNTQIVQFQGASDKLADGLRDLTKELSNLEGVIQDGRKR